MFKRVPRTAFVGMDNSYFCKSSHVAGGIRTSVLKVDLFHLTPFWLLKNFKDACKSLFKLFTVLFSLHIVRVVLVVVVRVCQRLGQGHLGPAEDPVDVIDQHQEVVGAGAGIFEPESGESGIFFDFVSQLGGHPGQEFWV